jgi:hypothetical protein
VTASPLICLDAFHSSLLRTQSQSTPSILLIPAAFPTLDLGLVAIEQIRLLAISHNTPALVCSSAGPRTAFAAYVDAWGRVLHLQAGGTSATFTVPIAYTHKQRARTIWERLGPIGIWDIALLALFPAQAAKVFKAVLKMKGVPLPDVLRYAGERADHLRGTRTASQAAREGEFI